jgi:hypothetical protein
MSNRTIEGVVQTDAAIPAGRMRASASRCRWTP